MIPLLAAMGSMVGGVGGASALGGAASGAGLLGSMGALGEGAAAISEGAIEDLGLTQLNQASGGKVGMGRKGDQAFVDNVMNASPEAQPMPVQSRVKYGQEPWQDYQSPNLGMGGIGMMGRGY